MLVLVLVVSIAATCSATLTFGEPRTPGYWKNHPEAWPVQSVTIGGVTYTKAEAIALLTANAEDATYKLASHLIAAKLNVFSFSFGTSDPVAVLNYISNADAFLTAHPLGSNPQGAEREYALSLKDNLEAFNQGI